MFWEERKEKTNTRTTNNDGMGKRGRLVGEKDVAFQGL
jgi:hypothetical protein